jgi:hypothetical protein
MSKYHAILIAIVSWPLLAATSSAQVTNVYPITPATKLEALEANTGTIIVKGVTVIGSLPTSTGTVTVLCKLDKDAGAGQKESGIRIDIGLTGLREEKLVIDYDELDSLLGAIDSLSKIDWTVTPLSSFNAVYTTKSGFRITASGLRRLGVIEYSIAASESAKRMMFTPAQLAQFSGLIAQAKKTLDSAGTQ